ncbi:hypothetical protein EON83_10425 [bacterium]|nr:MAG: hypothetical protein EON83_10425 [bacterium]
MNSESPLTRRDVVALFLYVFLGANVLMSVLMFLSTVLFARLPLFMGSMPSRLGIFSVFPLVVYLLLLPVVPIISSGVSGRQANFPLTKHSIRSLILPCAGLVMCGVSLPRLLSQGILYVQLSMQSSFSLSSTIGLNMVQNILGLSIGFALAFFPTIFDTLRLRVSDEENAA